MTMTAFPVSPPTPGSLTRAERRARTDALLEELASCGDGLRKHELLDELVRLNLDVAQSVVARFRNRGIDTDDLHQVANLALVKAIRGYDPGAGHAFLSYAVPTIRGEVRRYFRDHGWAVRPPRPVQEMQGTIGPALEALTQHLGRAPRPSEIAEHLEVELEDVIEAMSADGCFTPASLDAPTGQEGDHCMGDTLATDDGSSLASADARIMLGPALEGLSNRDRRIVYLRFFEGLTQREIGTELGVTQMQVSRLLARIMRDLREQIEPVTAP